MIQGITSIFLTLLPDIEELANDLMQFYKEKRVRLTKKIGRSMHAKWHNWDFLFEKMGVLEIKSVVNIGPQEV